MKFFKPNFWDRKQISLFSIFLLPFAFLVILLNFFKNLLVKKNKSTIPIICVGNIYLGGTGKTPLCVELFSILKNLNKNPAFIRKKYKSFHDEATLQKQIGPVYEDKKRVEAINKAIQNKVDVAILDDGFQDFSVNKSLSIICFNEKQWIGNGFVVPSGPLRETLTSLRRADCVMLKGRKNNDIEEIILRINKNIKIFYCKYITKNISDFKNKKVVCFAGIGNPNNFFNLLKENSIEVIKQISFPDHHNYSEKELISLINMAREENAILLTTEKDYYRISKNLKKNINCLKVKIEIENKNQFINEIKKII